MLWSIHLCPNVRLFTGLHFECILQRVCTHNDIILSCGSLAQVEEGIRHIVKALGILRVVALFHEPFALDVSFPLMKQHFRLTIVGDAVTALYLQENTLGLPCIFWHHTS